VNLLFQEIETFLCRTERRIALIDRCRPKNFASEVRAVAQAWARGEPKNPSFVYRAAPDLSEHREKLEIIVRALETGDLLAKLYAERAQELCLEAELAEAVGSARLRELADQRYGSILPQTECYGRARVWAGLEPTIAGFERVRSDDAGQPTSLVSLMQRGVRELELPFGVVVKENLPSAAAIGEGVILIQASLYLAEHEARRIVVHELYGHALPRVRARREPLGLFRIGAARGADDEEGRALLLERRHGLFGIERQVELGRRHIASWAASEGADWVETVRVLLDLGADTEAAMSVASRAQRGGGLGRERVYLPALLSVEQALKDDPELEAWLERGRLSIAAARVLKSAGRALSERRRALVQGSAFEAYE